MKTQFNLIFLLFLLGSMAIAQQPNAEFPKLTGPYLGQKPPGMTPELFAPGIVSTGANEMSICFSPAGDEVYYFIAGPSFQPRIVLSSFIENSLWSEPKELPFFDKARTDSYPFCTPDGKKLFFNSSRPNEGMDRSKEPRHHEIWFVERNENSYGEPRKIDFGGQYKSVGTFPSVASNGNLYFCGIFDTNVPNIFCSKFKDGAYSIPERLSAAVNGSADARNSHPYIAPDESYLLFDSKRAEDGLGEQDIYISFRDKQGNWSEAQNIGKNINSPNLELRPYVTYDKKYLFFISNRVNIPVLSEIQMTNSDAYNLINCPGNGLQDIYWVSAKFIEELKPKE